MTVPAEKSRPGRGLGRRGARSGSAAGADPGALLPCRVLAWPGKSLSTRGCDWPRRLSSTRPSLRITNLVSARSPGNQATTRRLNLKKEPSLRANCSAGAQGTMGRGVDTRSRSRGVARWKVNSRSDRALLELVVQWERRRTW